MLANLDDYGGEVFAPTMSKKSVHLSANPRVKDMDALFYLIIIFMELVIWGSDYESESAKIVVQPRAYADYRHAC